MQYKTHLNFTHMLLPVAAALAVSACGGSSSSDAQPDPDPGQAAFSEELVSWQFVMPDAGQALCFDFDLGEETPCDDSNTWDFKVDSGQRGVSFWSNGGVSGNGDGAAFGMFDWDILLQWDNATTDPASGADVSQHYFADSASSIFSEQPWYAYNLLGAHQLHPNYRVYLISTDPEDDGATQFALQVTGYYGGDSGTTSGNPSIRWVERSTPDAVQQASVDASSYTDWVYFSLLTGAPVADESADWHIAFRRSEIKLNGGASGDAGLAGALGLTPEGFYDENGEPVSETFTSTTPEQTLAALTSDQIEEPAQARDWTSDSEQSVLNPDYTGSYPQPLDYGWFTYYPTGDAASGIPAHGQTANTDSGALLRSGAGDSYARLRLAELNYADPADISSAQTWVFEFNVQPAPEAAR
ncbi:MAG: hypothetical protein EVA65_05035 [Oceanococcus sp.]|nr:MAG: hypothetical protein EVA65_05035 [Oceanococcus sp.]